MCFSLAEFQDRSLSLPKEHHLWGYDEDVPRLGWSGGVGARGLLLNIKCTLGLAKTLHFLYFLICKMGLIRLGEGELRGVVWIHKLTLSALKT